jgi:hypothetical protein
MSFPYAIRRIFEYLARRQRQDELQPGESLTDALLPGDISASASASGKVGNWRVACSCGFERQATTAWEATGIAKLHVREILGRPEESHTWTIEEPPSRRAWM